MNLNKINHYTSRFSGLKIVENTRDTYSKKLRINNINRSIRDF